MDCRSCGVVNSPGRRYCRECGTRLGQPCAVCHFFNGVEDKHCGGCGGWLKAGAGPLAASGLSTAAALDLDDDPALAPATGRRDPTAGSADTDIGGQGVSQSEIDGLFENILDEGPDDPQESGT